MRRLNAGVKRPASNVRHRGRRAGARAHRKRVTKKISIERF